MRGTGFDRPRTAGWSGPNHSGDALEPRGAADRQLPLAFLWYGPDWQAQSDQAQLGRPIGHLVAIP